MTPEIIRRRLDWILAGLGGAILCLAAILRRNWSSDYVLALCVVAALILAWIARDAAARKDTWWTHWWALTALFLLAISVKALPAARAAAHWVRRLDVPPFVLAAAGLCVAAGAGYYFLRFLAALPARLRAGFLAAGALCLLGEFGLERISQHYCELYGSRSASHAVADLFENLFAMAGLILFIDRLLLVLAERRRPPVPAARALTAMLK